MTDGSDEETALGAGGQTPPSMRVREDAAEKNEITIGRSGACDVVIDDARISRKHARLRATRSGLWVKDLRSRLGTSVNGQRIEGSVRLREKDILHIGPFAMRVETHPIAALLARATEMELTATGPVVLPERRLSPRWLLLPLVALVAAGIWLRPRTNYKSAYNNVFMIVAESPNGMMPLGTAFVAAGYPYLVTNQHIAEALAHSCMMEPRCHGVALRNEAPSDRFNITAMLPHPDIRGQDTYRPDLALFRVDEPQRLPPGIALADGEAEELRGERVAIISFPGDTMDVSNPVATIDFGTVGRVTSGMYIQHSANMTPGSSGSPLLIDGPRVVGVNYAALGLKPVMAPMGIERIATAGGINIAVSVGALRAFLEQAEK